ncbi:MAG: AAA family ATPase [Acidimicrobiaceae bacterium]|nr:AAA family ATPase [Acidimicrobiaceae bacterium]
MAFLQPANIQSRNDVPARLQAVAKCLREFLPDDVTVWLEWTGDGEDRALRREFEQQRFEGIEAADDQGEAYLVVLDPSSGIVVLEAPARIRAGKRRSRRRRIDRDRLRDLTAQRASELRRGLDARNVARLPVAVAAACPDVTAVEAASVRADVPVLCADDFDIEALRPALQEIVGGRRAPLPQEKESAARAAVRPGIVIRGTQGQLFAPQRESDDEILRTLDRRQERLAHSLGPGYRLIRGVAGSGKTLVLTYRARHMARHFPHWRILLLCFNKPLSLALTHQVAEHDGVRVRTLDALARDVLVDAGRAPDDERRPDFDRRRRDAVQAVPDLDEAELYDMVLVDEAQDLDEAGLDLAWAMLKPGRDHFVMALDGAQMIYRRRRAWNPPGITARGRTTILSVNYRNTRQILDLGRELLAGLGREPGTHQPDDLDVLVEPDQAVRTGLPPLSLNCSDLRGEAEAIAERVQELRAAGAPPDQIAVLLGTEDVRHDVVRLVPDAFDTKAGRNRDRIFDAEGRVRVATLGLLKGLEFRHVIIGGANHIWVRSTSPETLAEDQRRLLYVAVTRATETLTITYSGKGIMSALQSLPKIDPKPSRLPVPE